MGGAGILALALVLCAGDAGADPDARPIVVVVEGDAAGWSLELRQAIARELRIEAVAPDDAKAKLARGTVVVSLTTSSEELVVRYRPLQGKEIARRVRAPEEHANVVRTGALLTGNLVRNEAQEILDAARKPRGTPGTDAANSADPDAPVPGSDAGTPPAPPAKNEEAKAEAPKSPAESPKAPDKANEPPPPRPERPCLKIQANAPFHPVVISLVHPLATNFQAPNVRTPLALNLPYGRVGQIRGLGLGALGQVRCDVEGAQVHLVASVTGGQVSGLQLAGGFANTDETVMGVQGAIGVTKAMRLEGVQIAFVDLAREARGVQGGMVTYARSLEGVQAGLVNVANDVDGLQVGLVNIGRKVKGLQLGLVNVAEKLDGVSIGGITLAKNGYIRPIVWGGSSTYLNANVGLRFDTRWTYAQTTIGYVEGSGFDDVAQSNALGFHLFKPDQEGFLFDLEAGNQYRIGAKDEADDKTRGLIHAIAGWRVAPRLAFFAGMGIVYSQRQKDDFVGPDVIGGAIF